MQYHHLKIIAMFLCHHNNPLRSHCIVCSSYFSILSLVCDCLASALHSLLYIHCSMLYLVLYVVYHIALREGEREREGGGGCVTV